MQTRFYLLNKLKKEISLLFELVCRLRCKQSGRCKHDDTLPVESKDRRCDSNNNNNNNKKA